MNLGRTVELEERQHPLLRIVAGLIVLILLGGLVSAGFGGYWVMRAMHKQLPQLEGELRLSGLQAPVTVRRDAHGVPHIEAANLDDLLEAQGYVTAQDRLWQMDMARRMALGDSAEILGKSFVEHDRTQRVLAIGDTAERIAGNLPPQDRRLFEDYARGVNAYIESHQKNLPAEFRLLMYKPRAWTTTDSLAVALSMVQMLDERWQHKLEREQVTARLGPTLAAALYPTGSWRDHPPVTTEPDITAPGQSEPMVPLDSSQAVLRDLLRLRDATKSSDCEECIAGSNEWVVSGEHTASGKPMLSNDMHLGHAIPNIWYESDLHAGAFHAAGVTVPGLPLITAGHNDHIAWGFTALYGDTQDLYVERTNGHGEYMGAGGAWRPFERSRETIRVRGSSDVELTVERTDHGPVISQLLPHEQRTLSLRWSGYDPSADGIPLFELDSATDWKSFREALRRWWAPTLNVVYADDQGHIGYQAVGYIPERPGGLTGVPIADEQHEWQGFIPFDELPSTLDPPAGIIATANSRITPDGYPHPMTLEWAEPYRNERIWKWLAGKDKLTPANMLTLQTDIYSEVDQELGQRFAYAIDHAGKADAKLRQAADLMRSWNGEVSIDSPAAAVVAAARSAFWPMLLEPKLGAEWRAYQWSERDFAMEELVMHAPAAWLPKPYANWDDFLAACVETGMREAHAPADLTKWRYGYSHPVVIVHPLYSLLPWFKGWTGTGVQPQSGDTTTVKQVGSYFGPSQRFTIDWSDVDGATENIVMGQSGDPVSPYYRDQWPFWYGGTTFALPFSDGAVSRATAHTLRLLP